MDTRSKKIFDDFPIVDCNECERYWVNQCDGVKINGEGKNKPCNQFLATRNVVIPIQIKTLQKRLNSLWWGVSILAGVMVGIVIWCGVMVHG